MRQLLAPDPPGFSLPHQLVPALPEAVAAASPLGRRGAGAVCRRHGPVLQHQLHARPPLLQQPPQELQGRGGAGTPSGTRDGRAIRPGPPIPVPASPPTFCSSSCALATFTSADGGF